MGSRCSESAPSCARDRKSSVQKIPTYVDLDRGDRVVREAVPNGGQSTLRLRPYDFRVSPRQRPVRVDLTRSDAAFGTVGPGASVAFGLRPQCGAYRPFVGPTSKGRAGSI